MGYQEEAFGICIMQQFGLSKQFVYSIACSNIELKCKEKHQQFCSKSDKSIKVVRTQISTKNGFFQVLQKIEKIAFILGVKPTELNRHKTQSKSKTK